MTSFIVEYYDYKTQQSRLVRVESKDKINAALDAIWPVTVWTEEEFRSVQVSKNVTVDERPKRGSSYRQAK